MESYTNPSYIKADSILDYTKPICIVWDVAYIKETTVRAASINSLTQNKLILKNLGETRYYISSDIGGPSTIMLLEELYALGFRNFEFVGSCGGLNQDLEKFKWYRVKNFKLVSRDLIHILNNFDKSFEGIAGLTTSKEVNVATTDYFFKEDKKFIEMATDKDIEADVVDMEVFYVAEWWNEHKDAKCSYALQVCDIVSPDWTSQDLRK